MNHINFEAIEAQLSLLAERFCIAEPFQYVIVDEFLHRSSLNLLISEMPQPDQANKSSDYVFAKNKFENPTFSGEGGIFLELKQELLSQRFADVLSRILGKAVHVDPKFVGGGIHQGGEGSFLDMHADFSRHPTHNEWLRELNILLYLNRDYDESFGGHLELQDANTGKRGRIAPLENRLVLMLTKGHTLHGYKPISFPVGKYRTSLAAYAYSVDTDFAAAPARSTLWKPEQANMAKTIVAKMAPTLVRLKNKLMGSSTARRAISKDESISKK